MCASRWLKELCETHELTGARHSTATLLCRRGTLQLHSILPSRTQRKVPEQRMQQLTAECPGLFKATVLFQPDFKLRLKVPWLLKNLKCAYVLARREDLERAHRAVCQGLLPLCTQQMGKPSCWKNNCFFSLGLNENGIFWK